MKQLFLLLLFGMAVQAQTVYKTPSGQKYHSGNCRMVKNTSQALSVSDAANLGLDPCKICKPATIRNFTGKAKAQGEKPKTSQCRGRTKKGTRCKHMTSIANGYCFQHQDN